MKKSITNLKTRSSRQASIGSQQFSFLPEPQFSLSFPNKHTLPAKLLDLLLCGRTISHPLFESATGSWRAAASIHTLRKMGWPVETYDSGYNSEQAPRKKYIANYFISADNLEKLSQLLGGVNE